MQREPGNAGVRIRAVVLAAGLGRRLEPLTRTVPKPLLPVLGQPLLARTLSRLVELGCEAAAINLHHLGDQIRAAFGGSFRGLPLHYSEEPTILGTLGALTPLREFLEPAELILVINGDTLCEWPLAGLVTRHRMSGSLVTLLLAARPDPASFGGGVGIDRMGRVVTLAGTAARGASAPARRLVFAGAQILDPSLLTRVPAGVADSIRDLHVPLLAEKVVLNTFVTRRRWHDLGTPQRYLEGLLDLARDGWVSATADCAADTRLANSVIERAASVGEGAQITGSAVLPGAQVGARARLRGAIIASGAIVAAAEEIADSVVAADGARLAFR